MNLIGFGNPHHILYLQVRSFKSSLSASDADYETIKSSLLILLGARLQNRFRISWAKVRHSNAHRDLLTEFDGQKVKSLSVFLNPGEAGPSGPFYEAPHSVFALHGPFETVVLDQHLKKLFVVRFRLRYLAVYERCENSSIARSNSFITLFQLLSEFVRRLGSSVGGLGDEPHRHRPRTCHYYSKPVRDISPIRRQRTHQHLESPSLKVERILA